MWAHKGSRSVLYLGFIFSLWAYSYINLETDVEKDFKRALELSKSGKEDEAKTSWQDFNI